MKLGKLIFLAIFVLVNGSLQCSNSENISKDNQRKFEVPSFIGMNVNTRMSSCAFLQMKLINLTRGQAAIVDDEDYEWLMQWKWYADYSRSKFYARRLQRIGITDVKITMHRMLLGLKPDDIKRGDYINGNSLDNRKSNLRICTQANNCKNRGSNLNATSRFKGVSYKKRDEIWVAQITVDKKKLWLGQFPYTSEGEVAAAKCYDEAAKKYFKEFAYLNFKE